MLRLSKVQIQARTKDYVTSKPPQHPTYVWYAEAGLQQGLNSLGVAGVAEITRVASVASVASVVSVVGVEGGPLRHPVAQGTGLDASAQVNL